MRTRSYVLVISLIATVVTACASVFASPTSHTPTPAPATAAASAPATGSPASVPGTRVSGKVTGVTDSTITMADGTVFSTGDKTRVTRLDKITAADLEAGQYVAVTAQRQADNTLLASIVNVFDESMRGLGPGQRPMTGGNLMTNATIDKISGDTFTVTWDGGGANVKLAPDAKLSRIVVGKVNDIKVGDTLSVSIANGVAQNISMQ